MKYISLVICFIALFTFSRCSITDFLDTHQNVRLVYATNYINDETITEEVMSTKYNAYKSHQTSISAGAVDTTINFNEGMLVIYHNSTQE